MKKIKLISITLLFFLLTQMTPTLAAFWSKANSDLGNEIVKEEYPESKDVEPRIEDVSTTPVIAGGVEEVIDISLEECMRAALGNNPRIQAALQDVFASDARIRQAWSSYFPQFSWQTGYTKIKQLQLSDALGQNLVFNYYVLGQISASQL